MKTTLTVCLYLMPFFGVHSFALWQNSPIQTQAKIIPLFKEARLAEQQRNFPEAAKLYDKILQLDPNIAEVWTNKGLVLYELNKHRDALTAFQKAAALKPQLLIPQLFLGIEYLKLNEPQKAVGPLQAALAIEPHHSQAKYELANAYTRLEQFGLATELYRGLLQQNPQMEQASYRLGVAYLNWSKAAARKLLDLPAPSPYGKILLAELLAVGKLFQEAEANFGAAVTALPNSVEARLALGRFYLDFQPSRQRIQAAQEQLAKAKELHPRDLQVEIALVRLALLQADLSNALLHLRNVLLADLPFARKCLPELFIGFAPENLRKIIAEVSAHALTPGEDQASADATAQALLYSAYLELQELDRAERSLRDFERLAKNLGATPARPELLSYSLRLKQLGQKELGQALSGAEGMDLAIAAWSLGEYDRALQALLAVLKKAPDPRALYWLSLTCRALARRAFQEAINKNPESYRAHLLLADLANDSRDTAKALAEYEKAVSTGGADPEVHLLYIQFLTLKERDSEALERAQVAVERFPSHPALNYELGKLLLKTGSPHRAASYFQRSLQADPTVAPARAGLADSYAAVGEFEKAIQAMKQALDSDTDGAFHYRLARWYQKTGRSREADEALAISARLKGERREQERAKLTPTEP
jgi:tetratricopeptide (TPR) repeat protein